jgi:hypothetical protein
MKYSGGRGLMCVANFRRDFATKIAGDPIFNLLYLLLHFPRKTGIFYRIPPPSKIITKVHLL